MGDLFELKGFDEKKLKEYDNVVVGGGIYAGQTKFVRLLQRNKELLNRRKVAMFTVGAYDTNNGETLQTISTQFYSRFPKESLNNARLFCFRGGVNYDKLGFVHKKMVDMVKFALSKKDFQSLPLEERQFLEVYGKNVDYSDKEYIAPLIKFLEQ
jgi:menaquinone-dependent protoporphyrinogen IX oxidase